MFLRWLLTPSGFEGPDYIELTDWVEEEGWYYGNMFFSQDGERLIVIEKQDLKCMILTGVVEKLNK